MPRTRPAKPGPRPPRRGRSAPQVEQPDAPADNQAAAAAPGIREAQDRFVAAWGQMGSAWGISRTMAEVHALLFITGAPLCTDDVMDRLQISRGNASMSLRALVDWGVVSRVHKRGDRKEYFSAEGDVWAMFRAIVRERVKREVDPLLVSLHEIRELTRTPAKGNKPPAPADQLRAHNERLDPLLEFLEMADALSRRFVSPSGRGLRVAASLLARTAPPADRGSGPAARDPESTDSEAGESS